MDSAPSSPLKRTPDNKEEEEHVNKKARVGDKNAFETLYETAIWDELPEQPLLPAIILLRHKVTRRPLAIARGCDPAIRDRVVITGYIITYRLPETASMNMQASIPLATDHGMLKVVTGVIDQQYTQFGVLPEADTGHVMAIFLDTLLGEASGRLRVSNDADEEEEPIVIADEEAEDTTLCRNCMDKPADTMVLPCMHRSICRACSILLEGSNDKQICFVCRAEITEVLVDDALQVTHDG